MGKKMARAPIYYALAQVRFNTVLALEQYAPLIQEYMRKNGFPDFEKAFVATISISPAGALQNPSFPSLQPQARYSFLTEARLAGFILDQSMMMFHTTDYSTFEPFLETFVRGLEVVNKEAGLSYSERVGIRFLDAVCPGPNESLSEYLVPSVLGLFDKLAPRELVHTSSETRTKEGNTNLTSRTIIYHQDQEGAVFSPDLQPVQIKLAERFSKIKGLYAVLDTDSWLEEREKFDVPGLERRLDLLHKELSRSLDLTVTPHAIKSWE